MASSSPDYQALLKRVEQLETRDATNGQLINALERENKVLKAQMKTLKAKTETAEECKESCVFSARLGTDQDLSDKDQFKHIDKCAMVYKASPAFDATTCKFTAPVHGHYHMDMGMSQDKNVGHLEVMLLIEKTADGQSPKHAYIGKTSGPHSLCHKTMVLTLQRGDTVYGVVRRASGSTATIFWCAFHGHLISASNGDYSMPRSGEEQLPSSPDSLRRRPTPTAPPRSGK